MAFTYFFFSCKMPPLIIDHTVAPEALQALLHGFRRGMLVCRGHVDNINARNDFCGLGRRDLSNQVYCKRRNLSQVLPETPMHNCQQLGSGKNGAS